VRRRIVDFVEVFVDVPLEVAAERDVKGLYKKAFAGEIGQFTGVSDPYEPPAAPDLHIKTDEEEPLDSALKVLEKLEVYGYVRPLADVEEYAGLLTDNDESVHPAPGRSPMRPAEARNGSPDVRIDSSEPLRGNRSLARPTGTGHSGRSGRCRPPPRPRVRSS